MASCAWTCAKDIQVASSPCPSAPRTLMVEAKAHLDEGPCPPAGSRPYAKAVARLIRQLHARHRRPASMPGRLRHEVREHHVPPCCPTRGLRDDQCRSEEHTSELQSLMRISYAVFCLKIKNKHT